MSRELRLLLIEDSAADVELVLHELRRARFAPTAAVVNDRDQFAQRLAEGGWDVIISDYNLPGFGAIEALGMTTKTAADAPFIIVSGTIGEEAVVSALKSGARDCVMKSNLGRLGPVVSRELNEARARRQHELAQTALRQADDARRELLARLVSAQEEERSRIASDIHDDSIQVLTALAMRLDLAASKLDDAEASAHISAAADTARTAMERLRRLIFDLRPPLLDEAGLATAMEAYLRQAADETGISWSLEDQLDAEPDPNTRTLIYRIAQEAVTNACKHGRPTHIDVALRQGRSGIVTTIIDDGAGFDPAEAHRPRPGHLGLIAMRERAEMSGGWWTVSSRPGHGTAVEFLIRTTAPSTPPRIAAPTPA